MNKIIFKRLIIAEFFLGIIGLWKYLSYPYSLAPEDLKNAMRMYDEVVPAGDNFTLIIGLLVLIGYFFSLFLLYRFKKLGRQIYILVTALAILIVFSFGYIVFDPLEYLIEGSSLILSGFIISVSYFSKLEKEFI